MMNLLTTIVMICGLREALDAIDVDRQLASRDEMIEFAKVKDPDINDDKTRKFMISTCLKIGFALLEVFAIILGMIFYTGTMRWLMASVFALGFVTHYALEKLPKPLHRYYMMMDSTYCAAVMIVAPLLLLS